MISSPRIWHERLYYRCGRHRRVSESGIRFEVALTLLVIFAVIIIARLTPLKYIFLTGQALLWMATIGAVIGYKSGSPAYR